MRALLEPDRVDRLSPVGAGRTGRVLRSGRWAVKLPHPLPPFRREVNREAAVLRQLARPEVSVPAPALHVLVRDVGFVRDYVHGPTLLELLRAGDLPASVRAATWSTYVACEAYRARFGAVLDFTPPNLVWTGTRVLLVDPGPRRDPSPFLDLDAPSLWAALRRYVEARPPDGPIAPMVFPPSGRFAVAVPVGPHRRARLAWRNARALARWDLSSLTAADLTALLDVSTESAGPDRWLFASRYQDAPGTGPRDARGDGRALYLGTNDGGAELMLKGVGPTPLRWEGMRYHMDGRVSLNRTLWEASVADELARLGFDTPEVLAVLETDATTIDNSEIELPAAVALRIASSHTRLGHISRYADDPPAFEITLRHAGRRLFGPRFSPGRRRDRRRLVRAFSSSLGHDAGRTDALNIVAFNPTLGNVRLDGHLLDFSTVRFLDRTMPSFLFMEQAWTAQHHRWVLRKMVGRLVEALAAGLGLDADEVAELARAGRRDFADAYDAGYLEELLWLFGAPPVRLSRLERKQVVDGTRRLRALRDRSGRTHAYSFWRQAHPAPAFRLETQVPALVADWRRGADGRAALLVDPDGPGALSKAQEEQAEVWIERIRRVLSPHLAVLQPRRWSDRVRPGMEAEALARLVYCATSAGATDRWRSFITAW